MKHLARYATAVVVALTLTLAACSDESNPAALNDAVETDVSAAATSGPDANPTYKHNKKALIGKFTTAPYFGYPDGLEVIYEVAVDQAKYRNGNSHKAWFIPESSKGTVVFVKDLATGQGVTNSAPNIRISSCPGKGTGSRSFTDENVPFTCNWAIGNGPNRIDGTFELRFKRGGPGNKAVAATNPNLDDPQFTPNGGNFTGTFTFNGTDYEVKIIADRYKFRNGTSHRELVIPESHKKTVSPAFSGPGWRVRCPFDKPGVEAYGANESIECTWKAGNGAAPSGTVVLN